MKLLKLLLAAALMCAGSAVYAEPATKYIDDGFFLCDDAGVCFWDDDASMVVLNNDGHLPPEYIGVAGHGYLPEGATLPNRAFSYDAKDMGFCGCIMCGDSSKFTVTPRGRVNFFCRMEVE